MLSQRDLDAMQATQEAYMMDECELLHRTEGAADEYGVPVPDYAVVATVACGLSHSQTGAEAGGRGRQDSQVPIDIRRLRLPDETDVTGVDRVRITRRFGGFRLLSPVVYEVVGDPQRGPSGLLLQLQKVTE